MGSILIFDPKDNASGELKYALSNYNESIASISSILNMDEKEIKRILIKKSGNDEILKIFEES
jgi:hypothetical protein